jgi:hypothetical protein
MIATEMQLDWTIVPMIALKVKLVVICIVYKSVAPQAIFSKALVVLAKHQ